MNELIDLALGLLILFMGYKLTYVIDFNEKILNKGETNE